MRSAPGEFTTTAGGGAETVDAAATWKLVGGRLTGTTDGPEMASGFGTAAVEHHIGVLHGGVHLRRGAWHSCDRGCQNQRSDDDGKRGCGCASDVGTPASCTLERVARPRAAPCLH